MRFDVLLPLTLFSITVVSLYLFTSYGKRVETMFSGQKIRVRDAALIVVFVGLMITVVVFMPGLVLQLMFLFSSSSLLFLLVYFLYPKWPVALILPIVFLALYVFSWNLILMDLFALLLVLSAILYTSGVFSWKSTLVFASLLTFMDVLHVFGTKYMEAVAQKATGLLLPLLIIVPTFPVTGYVALGLGDLLLSGLFVTQTARQWGRRYGLMCCAAIALGMLFGEIILFNTIFDFLPATLFVMLGWGLTAVIRKLEPKKIPSPKPEPAKP